MDTGREKIPLAMALGTASAASTARRPTLLQRTLKCVLSDIMAGVYGPGDRIAEVELAGRLGVSRAPVREALRTLERDGLVEITPRRGARVIDPTPEEIAALFDLLAAVYGTVARLAVRHASDRALQQFSDTVELLARWQEEGRDVLVLLDVAYRAGTLLGENCGSILVGDTLRSIGRAAYWSHRHLAGAPKAWRRNSVTKMRKLNAMLHERSEQKSETAARKIVLHTQRLVLKYAH